MTVRELIDKLSKLQPEATVVIPIGRSGAGTLGGTLATRVKDVATGFDWNTGKVFICPEISLVKEMR